MGLAASFVTYGLTTVFNIWFVTAVLGNTWFVATVLRDIGVQPLYFVTRGVNHCLHVVCTVVFVTRGLYRRLL